MRSPLLTLGLLVAVQAAITGCPPDADDAAEGEETGAPADASSSDAAGEDADVREAGSAWHLDAAADATAEEDDAGEDAYIPEDGEVPMDAASDAGLDASGSDAQTPPEAGSDATASDGALFHPDTGACSHASAYLAERVTLTDPQALRCLCGVSEPAHADVVYDLGAASFTAAADQPRAVGGSGTDWSLWDNTTGMRFLTGDGRPLDTTDTTFLSVSAGDLVIRSTNDGSVVRTLPASLVGEFDSARFSEDETYVWTERNQAYRAFELDGTKWLDTQLTPWPSTSGAPLALADAFFVWSDTSTSSSNLSGHLRRYPRAGGPHQEIAVAGMFRMWLRETHFVTYDVASHIYRIDGTHVRLFDGTVSGGAGDFFWSNDALYMLSTGAKLVDYALRRDLGPDLIVFAESAEHPKYKLTRDQSGAWTGTALAPTDPIIVNWTPPARGPRLGCGPVTKVVPLDGDRVVLTTSAGYFVYDASVERITSFTVMPQAPLQFSANGNTIGLRYSGETTIYFYSPLINPSLVDSAPHMPEEYRIAPTGAFYTMAVARAYTLSGVPLPMPQPSIPLAEPPLVSPDGHKLAIRDMTCTYTCSFGIYEAGQLIGTSAGRAEAWLDNETIVTSSLQPSELRASKLDGTDRYSARCATSAGAVTQTVGTSIFQRRSSSTQAAQLCDFATGSVTPIPNHRGVAASAVANGKAIYVVDSEIIVRPY